MINKGIPASHIITMMYDDIANNSNNPNKGSIFNRPFSRNVYENIFIDYKREDVNPEVFFNVLAGNLTGVSGLGSGKVLIPSENDTVFVYMVDHGSNNYFGFPAGGITSDQLVKSLNELSTRVKSLLIFIEACFSGSLFLNPANKLNKNILAFTASDDVSSSYACYWDERSMAYLGDEFSVSWMEDVEKLNTKWESLNDLLTVVSIETQESKVCVFGNLTYLNHTVSSYLGDKGFPMVSMGHNIMTKPTHMLRQPIKSIDAQKLTYMNLLNKSDSIKYKLKYENLIQDHTALEIIFKKLSEELIPKIDNHVLITDTRNYSENDYSCYRDYIQLFSKNCINPNEVNIAYSYFSVFLNLCSSGIPSSKAKMTLLRLCEAVVKKDSRK